MTELLVVIAIIVLLLAVAVPAMDVLRGNTNLATAHNTVAAFVSRARLKAMELKRPTGVMFYTDSKSRRTAAAIVAEVQSVPHVHPGVTYRAGQYVHDPDTRPRVYYVALQDTSTDLGTAAWSAPIDVSLTNDRGAVLIDIVDGEEPLLLPPNVGVQSMQSQHTPTSSALPHYDPYIDGGLILFDGSGLLIAVPYAVAADGALGGKNRMNLSQHLVDLNTDPLAKAFLYSQHSLVILDKSAFESQGYTQGDFMTKGWFYDRKEPADVPAEQLEESWLNENTTPLLVNRYNGTLIKGE